MNLKRKEKGMEKFKILLVDDEEEFVRTLAERIQMRDLSSDVALNGEEALQKVQEDLPDVIVLDLKMPGMHGMEVLRRIKEAYPEVQVVILTGHGTEKHEQMAKELGAFEYLEKPVDLDRLVSTLKLAYRKKIEDTMVAATFAEAGDHKTAKEIMKSYKKK